MSEEELPPSVPTLSSSSGASGNASDLTSSSTSPIESILDSSSLENQIRVEGVAVGDLRSLKGKTSLHNRRALQIPKSISRVRRTIAKHDHELGAGLSLLQSLQVVMLGKGLAAERLEVRNLRISSIEDHVRRPLIQCLRNNPIDKIRSTRDRVLPELRRYSTVNQHAAGHTRELRVHPLSSSILLGLSVTVK